MKRFVWLLVMVMSMNTFVSGCGPKSPPPEEQKQREEQAKADMEKGMDAMKGAMKQINEGKGKK